MNNRRYSTNENIPVDPVIDYKFLTSNLPIEFDQNISHKQLSTKYSKLLFSNLSIYVYNNNKLVSGSPFKSFSQVIKATNIRVNVSIYLDTGYEYKGF